MIKTLALPHEQRRRLLQAGLLTGLALLGAGLTLRSTHAQGAGATSASVNLDVARTEHAAGRVTLIDIREPGEHATGVAAGARLLPMSQIAQRLGEIPKDQPVLLVCNTQNRSSKVATALRERGYTNVRYVEGGMSEWNRRRWPMVKPGSSPQR